MVNCLYITASVRSETSRSRMLGQVFLNALAQDNPDLRLTTRDVGITPPPHPTHAYTVANYTAPKDRTDAMKQTLAISDMLIDEMLAADYLIYAVPMYNFSVPSTFKAYVDNLIRKGRTFFPRPDGAFDGALAYKKALFITTRGISYGTDSPIKDNDLQEPWLRTVFGFIGLKDMQFVHADGLDFHGAKYRDISLQKAKQQLREIASHWKGLDVGC